MKNNTRIDRVFSRIPLTPKLLIITLLVWGLVWGILEYSQSDRLKEITDTQLTNLLEQQDRENRIRFDNYVMAYHDMAVLIVSQKAFVDHIRGDAGFPNETKGIKYHTEIPSWLPDASVMRHFIRIHNAVLIDRRGRVREVYQGTSRTVPQSLLPPSALLLQMSRGQSMLSVVDGIPYLIVSEAAKDPKGSDTSVLVLISPVDDEFLSASQGVISGKGIIALVEPIRQRIVASNVPDLIQAGTQFDTLTDRYLITSKAFFDWGGAEMPMQFTAFVSKDELEEMSRSMLAEGRLQRAFISLALLLSFGMILLWITRKIHLLTENIGDFSHNILNMHLPAISTGRDQLRILEERFAMFKDEIIGSRDRLKRQAEELLKEKTMYLDNLLHSSSMAVVVTDLNLKIKHFNPTAEMFFSTRSEDAIGKTVSEIRLDEKLDVPCFEKIINEDSYDEECICTTVNKTAKGEQILESKVSWVKDRDGNVSGLLLITQDITERRHAEEALVKRENFLNSIIDQNPYPLWISDDRGTLLRINRACCDMLNIREDEVVGKYNVLQDNIVEEQGKIPLVKSVFDDGKTVQFYLEYDSARLKNIHLDRTNRLILDVTIAPVKDEKGRTTNAVIMHQDITSRKQAEEQRLALERQLLHSQKLESIGILAGGVAHDFNNLLTAILGNLHLALMKLSPDSPIRPLIEHAIQASDLAADLTRQMLAYSGKGKFIVKDVDINEMVKENAFLLKSSLVKTAMMGINLQPAVSSIKADPGQIQQVIMNLLINASEAIGENAGVITLSTGEMECDEAYLIGSRVDEIPPAGHFVYLEVSDTGSGMDAETQQRLFDPFFSTKFTGRGLGMSAVFGIVRSHRGAIMVDSVIGRGTTIRVLFPAAI